MLPNAIHAAAADVHTQDVQFPLYTLNDVRASTRPVVGKSLREPVPLALEVDTRTGDTYALVFTSLASLQRYAHARNVTSKALTFQDADSLRVALQTMQRMVPHVTNIAFDPPGGMGTVAFAAVQDILKMFPAPARRGGLPSS